MSLGLVYMRINVKMSVAFQILNQQNTSSISLTYMAQKKEKMTLEYLREHAENCDDKKSDMMNKALTIQMKL